MSDGTREIQITQICCDHKGNLTVLDTEGRIWTRTKRNGAGKFSWSKVALPTVNP